MSSALMTFLQHTAAHTETLLDRYLPAADAWPSTLHQAMRHACFAGGKRLRPALVLAACRSAGGADTPCEPAMAAVEMLHTYTLVHDDLPAMDDDDLRRGQPTCHIAFGEATAILAGDALLTRALGTLAAVNAEAVQVLADASGSEGVVGGQQEDLEAEGDPIDPGPAGQQRLRRIHCGKTAALIRACCEIGAICAQADDAQRQALRAYGEAIGLAFQVADDILDVEGDQHSLGKTPGKDAAAGKWTYVSCHGLDAAKQQARELQHAAHDTLAPFGAAAAVLHELADFIVERAH